MKYSYEFKLQCIEMYYLGMYPETPKGISEKGFRCTIRKWVRMSEAQGTKVLNHKFDNKVWSADEKLELVQRVLAGESNKSVAFSAGINDGSLYQWVRNYKKMGYNGLINKRKGRNSKDFQMKESIKPEPINESEREELIRLRAEVQYFKAENAVIKKEIALRHEKWAAQLKAKKQQSSKNSEKQDIN